MQTIDANTRFHLTAIEACNKPVLSRTLRILWESATPFAIRLMMSTERSLIHKEHDHMFDTLVERDTEAVGRGLHRSPRSESPADQGGSRYRSARTRSSTSDVENRVVTLPENTVGTIRPGRNGNSLQRDCGFVVALSDYRHRSPSLCSMSRARSRRTRATGSVPAMTDLPEVDRAPDERTALIEMLDYYRTVMVRKAEDLTDDQLAVELPPSDLTLGGLLMHLALVEDSWFQSTFLGGDLGEPWSSFDWDSDPDWEFHNAHEYTKSQIIAQYEGSLSRSRAVVEAAESLDVRAAKKSRTGREINLRWILVHLIEEYARHAGHADLIRESIDGATGD